MRLRHDPRIKLAAKLEPDLGNQRLLEDECNTDIPNEHYNRTTTAIFMTNNILWRYHDGALQA